MARWSASVTYFMLLSLAPLLLLVSSSIEFIVQSPNAQQQILDLIAPIVPPVVIPTIRLLLQQVSATPGNGFRLFVGIIILVITTTSMVLAIQDALHTVWSVQLKAGLRQSLAKQLKAIVLVLLIAGLITLLSIASIFLTTAAKFISLYLVIPVAVLQFANIILLLVTLTLLFALVIRMLSGVTIPWLIAIKGSIVITILFLVGQLLLAFYIYFGTNSFTGVMGAALVLMIWLYYSVQVFLFGTELIAAYAAFTKQHFKVMPGYEYINISTSNQPKYSFWSRLNPFKK